MTLSKSLVVLLSSAMLAGCLFGRGPIRRTTVVAQPAPQPARTVYVQPSQPHVRPAVVMNPGGLDLSGSSNFEGAQLASGFYPDPHQISGYSGGAVSAGVLGARCRGWIAQQPDHVVDLHSNFAFLRAFVQSHRDTTLVIRTPNGGYLCNDDTFGHNPSLNIPAMPGRYLVWVGSYQQGDGAAYTLSMTEIPHMRP